MRLVDVMFFFASRGQRQKFEQLAKGARNEGGERCTRCLVYLPDSTVAPCKQHGCGQAVVPGGSHWSTAVFDSRNCRVVPEA